MTIGLRIAYRLIDAGATPEEVRLLLAAELGLDGMEAEAARVEAAALHALGVRPVGV